MGLDQDIARHYTHGSLENAILDALNEIGKPADKLTADDLARIDEFHFGGRQATVDLVDQLDLPRGARVLDVGSGIGGPARFLAQSRGWQVEGIDLTPEYVEVADRLTRRLGMADAVSFRHGSALDLPFADAAFDGAYMLHVGMNIADKKAAFAEVRRVLKPGGVFAIYDIMRESDGTFSYPVPWASGPETDFTDTAQSYRRLLAAAGFEIEKERNRRDFALDFFQQIRQRLARGIPQGPGLAILMGATTPAKIGNAIGLLQRGVFAPTELISRAA
jgi:ubiquinone/menaquinone biosynthesis C-methylase UbiE